MLVANKGHYITCENHPSRRGMDDSADKTGFHSSFFPSYCMGLTFVLLRERPLYQNGLTYRFGMTWHGMFTASFTQ